jgi:hypothetical protein
MKGLFPSFALVVIFLGCQHVSSQAWRASEDNGDKPGIGFELRKEGEKVTGSAFLLDPDFPHDFTHGVKLPMMPLEQSAKEVKFSVQWNGRIKETLVFQFKAEKWPESFDAAVTQIRATEQFATQTYGFRAIK